MYSGIVQGNRKVVDLVKKEKLVSFSIEAESEDLSGLKQGASISIDGVCLSVSDIEGQKISFDVMAETLDKTTLSDLAVGDLVNFERSLKFGDEIGGHLLSGHIDTTAKIINIEQPENNYFITFKLDPKWMKYIFAKGYIGLHGMSLTVVEPDTSQGTFQVCLIPETLAVTNISNLNLGDKVNIEIDRKTQIIVDTTERIAKT